MAKYKLTLAYEGTQYGGWQTQPNAVSIQSLVEKALSTVLRAPTPVMGAGRTDAGVHARGQVAHFTADSSLNLYRLHHSLNGLLPPDIRVLSVKGTFLDFHARYSAISKEYHYHLHLDRQMDPFKRLYSFHVHGPLDLTYLQAAARLLLGTHDFTTFANEANSGSAAKNPIRTLIRLDIVQEPGGIRLEFEGDGFLYKMVRNITGTLLDVGRGKLAAEEIPALLRAKDRRLASAAAPPHGLFLMQVRYGDQQESLRMMENRDPQTSPSEDDQEGR